MRLLVRKNNCYQFLNICFNTRIAMGAERGRSRFKRNEGNGGGRGLMQRFSREAAAATGIAVSGAPILLLNVYSVTSEPASRFGTP